MNLSNHFTLEELTHSDTAQAEGIPNQPAGAEVESLRALCQNVLEPLREALGRSIKVNSGYRGPALNQRLGGAATSQHMSGQAADIQCPGVPVVEVFKLAIRLGLPFDQIIYEANRSSRWVHVSHRPGANRGDIRTATFGPDGRPTAYPPVTAEQALAMREPATRSSRGAVPGYVEGADEPVPDLAVVEPAVPAASTVAAAKRRSRPTASATNAPKAAGKKTAKNAEAVKTTEKTATEKATSVKRAALKAPSAKGLPATAAKTKAAAKKVAVPVPSKTTAGKAAAKKATAKKAAAKKTAMKPTSGAKVRPPVKAASVATGKVRSKADAGAAAKAPAKGAAKAATSPRAKPLTSAPRASGSSGKRTRPSPT